MSAHQALALALSDALEASLRVPCAGREEWTSESAKERATAALACDGCPAMTECHEAAEETNERHGVWGGQDRSPTTRPPGRPKTDKENHR